MKMRFPALVHRGAKAVVKGRLLSLDATCASLQPVTLKVGSKKVGPRLTSTLGEFRFAARLTRTTKVSVIFPGTPACQKSDASRVIRVT